MYHISNGLVFLGLSLVVAVVYYHMGDLNALWIYLLMLLFLSTKNGG